MKKPIRYLSLCGLLGYGYSLVSLKNALDSELDFVGVDGGSTDPGPYYLGSGKGFVKRLQVKRDLELILPVIKAKKIPLIIGSAGGCGARPHDHGRSRSDHDDRVCDRADDRDRRSNLRSVDVLFRSYYCASEFARSRLVRSSGLIFKRICLRPLSLPAVPRMYLPSCLVMTSDSVWL